MVNPGAVEFCDGIDNDCNGMVDDNLAINTYYLDSDNDGYGALGFPLDTCLLVPPSGYTWSADDLRRQ